MRVFVCEERRMLRALHARWPLSPLALPTCDLHWLVRVRPARCWCVEVARTPNPDAAGHAPAAAALKESR